MYFLPEEEVTSCGVSAKLGNNIKLMRQVALPLGNVCWEYFVKSGTELVFYSTNLGAGEITSRKINHDGVVQQFKGDALPRSKEWAWKLSLFLFESLPIIGIYHSMNELKKIKFSFYAIPGVVTGRIKIEDVILDVGYKFHAVSVCVSSNYVAVIIRISQYDSSLSIFTSSIGSKNLKTRQKLLVLFEIQMESENCYKFVELCRNNLEELIGKFTGMEMIFNRTEDVLLFHAKTFNESPNHLVILIYNKNSDRFEETIKVFENPVSSRVFFVNHTAFKGGVIVAASFYKNQIKLFSKNIENRYTLLKSFSVNFGGSLDNFACCCSNRKNQILFFDVKFGEVCIFDVFDPSNKTFLTYGCNERHPQFYFNETGEEIYVHYDQRTCIYLYKSMYKSLLLQSASIVAKTYTKRQLADMKLPKQIYKYLLS